jgi:hypothetical protein
LREEKLSVDEVELVAGGVLNETRLDGGEGRLGGTVLALEDGRLDPNLREENESVSQSHRRE